MLLGHNTTMIVTFHNLSVGICLDKGGGWGEVTYHNNNLAMKSTKKIQRVGDPSLWIAKNYVDEKTHTW
jgi:hypothetical protein